jgi:hypothetical protein
VNGNVFVISFSGSPLLVYGQTTDFYMLILCPATLLKVLFLSVYVLLDSFRSFSCRIMSLINGKFDFFLSYS